MNDINSFTTDRLEKKRGGMMKFLLIACLSLFVIACSESSVTTTETTDNSDDLVSSTEVSPHAILSSGYLSESVGMSSNFRAKGAHTANEDGFASPLFGLATAPNGNILVADAGAGVATLDGRTNIPLPGVSDMSPIGRGTMWALKGLTGAPGDDTGQALYRVSKGKNKVIADLFSFEATNNPDGGVVDSNPFDVESLGGKAALVVDAGGNDLLHIDNKGNLKVLAVFPDELVSTANIKELVGCPDSGAGLCGLPDMMPAQPVPTSVAIGPDGYYYVGELKGFPAPSNASNIWRIAPDASWAECGSSPDCMKVFDGGFTSIIDLVFDSEGNLHVAELDEQSWFAVEVLGGGVGGTINSCDLDAASCTEVATEIPILTAITFGNDGRLWATQNALIPNLAEVVAID
ncbi:ScyD/ScyE family protein [Aliifodinibius salicampi]|uniref:ScyD/ScyE family protein n=1 Tax=Fodinibius salicampi TaxID=1920655 RepID=A0ABT3PW06_9BACT|nr:ScyD/ScyE family protein [Fodinibius salicampi]MCW9712046.1 ScyD/ScyE family protein [Fodinibius salicampi]